MLRPQVRANPSNVGLNSSVTRLLTRYARERRLPPALGGTMPGEYQLDRHPIPEGFQIFEERLDVAGLQFRREDAEAFIIRGDQWLELELDPGNAHDPNAIKVIGCNGTSYNTCRHFIGFVPKNVARAVVRKGFWGLVQPRLLKTYVSPNGFVEVLFQLLGPKGRKKEYSGGQRSRA
jgi:hypothetical protein